MQLYHELARLIGRFWLFPLLLLFAPPFALLSFTTLRPFVLASLLT